MNKRAVVAKVLSMCLLLPASSIGETIDNWTGFDEWVATNRHYDAITAPLFPPGMFQASIQLGPTGFDPVSLPTLEALPSEAHFSVAMHRIFINENGSDNRHWVVSDSEGNTVRELCPPTDYDVPAWIASAYGSPNTWLSEGQLEKWRENRDPARITISALLIATNDYPTYIEQLRMRSTNGVVVSDAIVIPSDTNRIAIAQFRYDPVVGLSGWIYSPFTNKTTAVFQKGSLLTGRWSLVQELGDDGTLGTGDESSGLGFGKLSLFSFQEEYGEAMAGNASGFFTVGEVSTDTDGDGISDAMESLVHGSSRHYSDTDGDDVSDWDEINRYGTNPDQADSDDDGVCDGVAIAAGFDPNGSDSDGDGLSDYEELTVYMTKPFDEDTDGDGLLDYIEVMELQSSPFDSDTDFDYLSDSKEVLEVGANPLSRDSDGDGIDDRTEWASRNYGLNPTNALDGMQDYDGDSFGNVEEISHGWSHLSHAVSNAVPVNRMIKIHPMEYPSIESGLDYLIALGNDPVKGARIRIPRSTQYGTANTLRKLYYTKAPGIFLGDRVLSSDGCFEIPDSHGDVEMWVWSSREHGGQDTRLSLVNESGATNKTFEVKVPALTKATIKVSNANLATQSTNLVPGVLGVLCTSSTDALFGKPRLTINPTLSPDSDIGHRSLWCTDALLAKISGATTATNSVNWLRWNSVHSSRHGFELEPGVSRVEIGLDFDMDGVLDTEEVELVCDVTVLTLQICGDTNRDGEISEDDLEGKKDWRPWRGALLAVDDSDTSADPYKPWENSSLSRIQIAPTIAALPSGYTLSLLFSNSSKVTVYNEEFTNRLVLVPNVTTQGLSQAESKTSEFRVSYKDAGSVLSPGTSETVTLQLKRGVSTVGSDSIALKRAPFIVPWNTLPLYALFTSATTNGYRFPPDVAPTRQYCLTSPRCQWVQDMFQMTAFQLDTAKPWSPMALDLNRQHEDGYVDLLPYAVGRWQDRAFCYLSVNNSGDGGNIEATPPLPGYPFGRLVVGDGPSGGSHAAVDLIERQGLQGPAIVVPTAWLAVGHVDEICCFVDRRKVLVPSPRLAFDLIAEQVALHHGAYTNTFVWGRNPTNYIHRMQDIVFDSVITNAMLDLDMSAAGSSFSGPDWGFEPFDHLFCDGEIMEVSSVIKQGSHATVALMRGVWGTSASAHAASSTVCRLSQTSVANIAYGNPSAYVSRIASVKAGIKQEIHDVEFVEAPVLFTSVGTMAVAGSPNLVNAVVDGDTAYMTDPGCELFRDALPVSGKTFVGGTNAWECYHCLDGELHCGSEAERYIPSSPPFWMRSEFEDWPYEAKGVSP